MPNWTSNIIRAEGPEADLREFLETVRGPTAAAFDFNRIVPMPPMLRHTAKGGREFDGKRYENWYVIDPDLSYGDPGHEHNERPLTPDELVTLRDIGYSDWYEWSLANWGTKWNAFRPSFHELPEEDGAVEVTFDTAWTAPFPIFKKLATLFPKLTFVFQWTDEDDPDLNHKLTIHADDGRAS